jgi:chromosome segregation ATPase
MLRAELRPKPSTQETRPRTVTSPGSQGSPTQQAGLASPPSKGSMSGLANMKRKLANIDNERDKITNSQQKIKDDVSEMTDSFRKMSGDIVNLQKYLSDLSESFSRQMKELKEMMYSLINSRLIPKRGSPKRKKGEVKGH